MPNIVLWVGQDLCYHYLLVSFYIVGHSAFLRPEASKSQRENPIMIGGGRLYRPTLLFNPYFTNNLPEKVGNIDRLYPYFKELVSDYERP